MKFLVVPALLFLSGCTPFVSFQHLSDYNVANDGYDMGCLGSKRKEKRLEVKGAICKNVRGGEFFNFTVEYDLIGQTP